MATTEIPIVVSVRWRWRGRLMRLLVWLHLPRVAARLVRGRDIEELFRFSVVDSTRRGYGWRWLRWRTAFLRRGDRG